MKKKNLLNPKRFLKNNLYKLYNPMIYKFYKMSPEEINEFRNKRFKEILEYSIKYVPFYNNQLYKDFYYSYNINHFDHLHELPLIKKQTVKDNNELFWSNEKYKLKTRHTTSGTSGKSLEIHSYINEKLFSLSTLNYWYEKIGMNKGWKIYLSGFMTPSSESREKYWIDNMDKSIYLSIYEINEKNIKVYETIFRKYNPTLLYGYPSSIYEFSKVIVESARIQNFLSKRKMKIVCTSEVLDPKWESFINQNVGNIYNLYGSQEGAHFASTFNDGIIYNHPYFGMIESVDSSGNRLNGEMGEAIVTGLNKKSMPLIRYEIGDTVTLDYKDDGWDIVDSIGGRSEDLIRKKDGSKISLLNFHASKNIKGINLSQIIQIDYYTFQVNISFVKGTEETQKDNIKYEFESEMKKRLNYNYTNVNFDEVKVFEKGPNGKFKSVIIKDF